MKRMNYEVIANTNSKNKNPVSNNVQRPAAWLRKRKMLTVLPLLMIPFLTMAFWALGGGKGNAAVTKTQHGLNLNLPDANLKEDKAMDKLSFYDLAAKDSSKLAEQMHNDPFYQSKEDMFPAPPLNIIGEQAAAKYNQPMNASPYASLPKKPEDEIMKKLALLQEQLNQQQAVHKDTLQPVMQDADPSLANNMNRLEYMMQSMSVNDTGDPQMHQMDAMLTKILDIQHPERVSERIKETSLKNKEEVFPVQALPSTITISLLDTGRSSLNENGFFGLDDDDTNDGQNAIEAVVHENQTLVNGAVIKLRLLNDLYVAGNLIPKESFVFGLCSLNGERLEVEINSIRCDASIFRVKLDVYDMDGLPGIYIPGAITRDVAKQSADNSLQLMELSTMDPSLKAQATASGINTVKNLLSKKVKLVKVIVKAGYKVLLKQKEP
jgi:conjugative transposon TraM protein